MKEAIFKDYLKLHFIVLIWGFTAILGLLISIPSVELVFFRTFLSAIAIGLLLLLKKRFDRFEAKELFKIISTGAIIAFHWILFFAAARVSNASVCLSGMATCTLWTSLLEPLLHKRNIKGYEIFLGLMVVVGLYIIFSFEFNHFLGLTMAVVSAFLSSLFSVINSKLTLKYEAFSITFYEMIGACLTTLLFLPIYKIYFSPNNELALIPSAWDWIWIMVLVVVCTVYAFSVSVELMQRISAFAVNLTVNLEPVYGIILAVIIFKDSEKMELGFYFGTIVILFSVLSYPFLNRVFNRPSKTTEYLH